LGRAIGSEMELLSPPILVTEILAKPSVSCFQEQRGFSLAIVDLTGSEKTSEWKKWILPEEEGLPIEKSISRALTRFLLAQKLKLDPLSLKFHKNKNGKPQLQDHQISFNVSHSDSYWALAFSPSVQIGLDLETWKSWDRLEKIASRIFTENEKRSLEAIQDLNLRTSEALKIWTLKESMIKLEGLALFEGLAKFEFQLQPSRCLQNPEVNFSHFTWQSRFCLTVASRSGL
jgi:phosphopantetheinyl transferase